MQAESRIGDGEWCHGQENHDKKYLKFSALMTIK